MTTDERTDDAVVTDERTAEEAERESHGFQAEQEADAGNADAVEETTVDATGRAGDDAETSAPVVGDDGGPEEEHEPVGEGALLPDDQSDRFTSRWEEIQASFVDRPQEAVQEADALVADLLQRVTGSLANERERLESQWAQGDEVSTEDLRVALTRYRTFFERLLST